MVLQKAEAISFDVRSIKAAFRSIFSAGIDGELLRSCSQLFPTGGDAGDTYCFEQILTVVQSMYVHTRRYAILHIVQKGAVPGGFNVITGTQVQALDGIRTQNVRIDKLSELKRVHGSDIRGGAGLIIRKEFREHL